MFPEGKTEAKKTRLKTATIADLKKAQQKRGKILRFENGKRCRFGFIAVLDDRKKARKSRLERLFQGG